MDGFRKAYHTQNWTTHLLQEVGEPLTTAAMKTLKKDQIKFWYRDNWSGLKKEFKTYRSALTAAKNETGMSIAIYAVDGNLFKMVNASGFSPA